MTGCWSAVVVGGVTELAVTGMAVRRCPEVCRSVFDPPLTRVLEWMPLMRLRTLLEVLQQLQMDSKFSM